MNTSIFKILIALLFSVKLFVSCDSENTTITDTNSQDIVFTTPPFDLLGIDAKFSKDIAYDIKERTLFDIFLPSSNQPTPIVIFIHGGGFTSGSKEMIYSFEADHIRTYLSNNIAFATISYTLLDDTGETEGVLKPMNDAKRALQYIRSRAADFNIDKTKVVLTGFSAGAGTSLWIAFNDDMSDSSNADPVLRESTRVSGVAVYETQATYNIDRWISDVFVDYGITLDQVISNPSYSSSITRLYGIPTISDYNTPEVEAYKNTVDMLQLFTADDPEIWVNNVLQPVVYPSNATIMYHHAFHARELKERADIVGVANVTYYGLNPVLYADPSGESYTDFIIRKLTTN